MKRTEKQQLSISLPKKMYECLQKKADEQMVSMSAIIRHALQSHLTINKRRPNNGSN